MTTTQSTQQTNTTTSAFGDFGSFQPGTMAVCSSALSELAEVLVEISQKYGQQVINALQEQTTAAEVTQNTYDEMGENELLSSLTTGVGEIASGATHLGTSIYDACSMSAEHGEMNQINEKITNAKTFKTACQKRLDSDPERVLTHHDATSTIDIDQFKRVGYDFGKQAITPDEREAIYLTDKTEIEGQEGVMANVNKYIQSQEDRKNTLQRQISDRSFRRNNYAQGVGAILKGFTDSVAGYFRKESALWQGRQSVANNALQNAQKATDTLSSQVQSTQQQALDVYKTMEQINQANAYK
ncbi:hypothetical protein [Simkania sp.]|uniref:hypothetical protein n=1 Tax=Simkania sp. TaxID=34094 RepID=UPI003B52445A